MSLPPVSRLLPNGRLHLQHGPIDLIVEAVGVDPSPSAGEAGREGGLARQREPGGVARPGCPHPGRLRRLGPPLKGRDQPSPTVRIAYEAAARRFATLLEELCAELPALRRPARPDRCALSGPVARRMWKAVAPFAAESFVTPMAAVAGAVAEEVLAAMAAAAPLRRAAVNNGGDIALHLGPGEHLRLGLVDRPDRPSLFGTALVADTDPIRGVATSGWRGRSFSLGIADAVTILARTAAEADAAATMVANAVDLPGHPAVTRLPARDVQADSDLGGRLVTRAVGKLAPDEIEAALASGLAKAEDLASRGLIHAAALHLQGRTAATAGTAAVHSRRHAEEACAAGRLEARTAVGACFETRTSGPLLRMTPLGIADARRSLMEIAA